MTTVTTEILGLPHGSGLTYADLESMPDDGWRYELLDGVLIVGPAPTPRHQRVVARLHLLLHAACPPDLEVLFAPLNVVLAGDTCLQPDLLVAPRSAFAETNLPQAPTLAIEVASPSTRGVDMLLKKDRLRRGGCAHYWVVDPAVPTSITTWSLVDGAYVDSGTAVGEECLAVTAPFAVDIVPADLVD
ncbi:Uma2 family endonuclease [Gordonia polyisoprenivorans]|uniref:Uma2 family endonuclease n=1 Tax=Gordonia polyisoprenivorans TaxID=84595 RepID=UPI001AD7BA17|nr:Uma2 family endonuclease [Gordonia polyisoprenivorans]QTI71183.1 Uma2 family endonuclease [Gordonia polyisoprenivorans]